VKRQVQSLKGENIMFKKNEGILDRIVRVTLSVVLIPAGLFVLGVFHANVPGILIAGFGGWLLITGLTGFCPLYIPLGISTVGKEKELFAKCRSMMAGSGPTENLCVGRICGPRSQTVEETPQQQG
jgi:hypothetical protein